MCPYHMIRFPIKQKRGGNYETYYEEKQYTYRQVSKAAGPPAALGLGGCGAGAQMPDTLKVQNEERQRM